MSSKKRSKKKGSSKRKTLRGIKIQKIIDEFKDNYFHGTPLKVKLIDAFIIFTVLTAAIQLGYVLLVGSFPFNGFLGGFFACITLFTFAVSLRKQVNPEVPKKDRYDIVPEKSFADFVVISVLALFLCVAFIG